MRKGYIIWDANSRRLDIMYQDGTRYGGLHCGDTLDALIDDRWHSTRVEYRHSTGTWYLVGVDNDEDLLRLTVRH